MMSVAERAPDVLLPYQKAWIADQSQVKLMEKSRRVGLSWAEAADAALTGAQSKEAGGDDSWYIGYNQDMAKEFILDVAFWAKHYSLAAGALQEEVFVDEDKAIVTYHITFASGYRVTALSSRPSNLRGKQGRVVIDEAAFHDDLDGLIKAAMALLMWGGKVRIISTHDGDKNPFNELILECRAGKKPYSVHRVDFDTAVSQGLFRRICLTTGKPWKQEAEDAWVSEIRAFYGAHASEELDVIPGTGRGTYLSRALIDSCVKDGIPVPRLALTSDFTFRPERVRQAEVEAWCEDNLLPVLQGLDKSRKHFFGEDFARSGDLSCFWALQETQSMELKTPFVIELRNVPFEQQKQVLWYMIDRMPRFQGGAMDARGNGSWLAEVTAQKYGAERIVTVMLTQEWYRENMPPLKAAFEDRVIEIPKDSDVIDDLRTVKIDKGVAKVPDDAHTKGSDGNMRHGDTAIALALGHYAALRLEPAGGVCEGFQSVAKRGQASRRDDFDSRSRSMM